MRDTAVAISNLHKRYGDVVAIDGVSLQIYDGEVFGLVGPNGAGKTTTIKILLGLTRASRGQVRVLGLDPESKAREIRARVGYAMQELAVDLYLTGRENLQIFAALFNLPASLRTLRINEVLEWAGLLEAADRRVRTYSGGMKRRLSLGLSLLHRPELFFLDEPTLGLDVRSRRQLWQLIEQLKVSGTTVVLTTHYLEEANQLCDRVGVLDQGNLVGLGTPEALKNEVASGLHRLVITFNNPSAVDHVDLPPGAQVRGADAIYSGSRSHLWEIMSELGRRLDDDMKEIGYTQPTLDDVVLALTESQGPSSTESRRRA